VTLLSQILDLISTSTDDNLLQIISPYVTINPIRSILRQINPATRIELTTTFEQELFIEGSSSIGAIRLLARRENTTVFVVQGLHAKAYLFGKHALVGSANCTDRGLGQSSKSNIEILCMLESDRQELLELVKTLEPVRRKIGINDIDNMISLISSFNALTKEVFRNRLDAILRHDEWIPSCSLKYLLKYFAEGSFYRIPAESKNLILKDAQYLVSVLDERSLSFEAKAIGSIASMPIVQLAIESALKKNKFICKCLAARGVPLVQVEALENWAKYCLVAGL